MQQYLNFIIPYLYAAQHVPENVHQLHVQQPSTYEKPEAASAVLGSDDGRCVARNMCLTTSINYTSNKHPSTFEKPEAASAVLVS
jgi:hypothetical protein